jgi:hypothetical protein
MVGLYQVWVHQGYSLMWGLFVSLPGLCQKLIKSGLSLIEKLFIKN